MDNNGNFTRIQSRRQWRQRDDSVTITLNNLLDNYHDNNGDSRWWKRNFDMTTMVTLDGGKETLKREKNVILLSEEGK